MSSSGLVAPSGSSVRRGQLTLTGPNVPEPTDVVPVPSARPPSHVVVAVLVVAMPTS